MLNLSKIKQYLKNKRVCTIKELVQEFAEDQTTLQCMLQHFIAKGCVCVDTVKPKCGNCNACPLSQVQVYRWVATA